MARSEHKAHKCNNERHAKTVVITVTTNKKASFVEGGNDHGLEFVGGTTITNNKHVLGDDATTGKHHGLLRTSC
jgi:hypothetical protein